MDLTSLSCTSVNGSCENLVTDSVGPRLGFLELTQNASVIAAKPRSVIFRNIWLAAVTARCAAAHVEVHVEARTPGGIVNPTAAQHNPQVTGGSRWWRPSSDCGWLRLVRPVFHTGTRVWETSRDR